MTLWENACPRLPDELRGILCSRGIDIRALQIFKGPEPSAAH
jgi:hypothetical protein